VASLAAKMYFFWVHPAPGKVDGDHRFRLRLLQARLQHRSDAAETQLPQETI
jgi:hypothetical protein